MASRVYVIELAPGAGRRRDPRIPWVYVGSSAREPEIRFRQHLRGYRSGRLVRRFGLRLRPDLYDDLPECSSAAAGAAAELERARELAAAGFVAHSDGVSHGEGSGAWTEWCDERLEAAGGHVDVAAATLRQAAFEPLAPRECARLLHGERGFWQARFIDPADPPPAVGQFAHVRLDALEARVGAQTAA